MIQHGLYHSLVMAQISTEEERAELAEEDDVVEDLEMVEMSLPSLTSLTLNNHISNCKQVSLLDRYLKM